MSVQPRPKWWQQEIIEDQPTKPQDTSVEIESNLNKIKEFADTFVQQLKGPDVGVTYKVEVPGSLGMDGTFWACPLSSGFIQDKLEPLSNQLMSSIEDGTALRYDGKHGELFFAQSNQYNIWMRGVVVKEVDKTMMKLRFIDVGSIEDHQKVKIWKVPELLASIPYMAFHCTLFEEDVKMSYTEKYRFNDLVKKQILNFTCKSIKNVNDMNLLFGQMETIIDKPVININEEIRQCLKKREGTPKSNKVKEDIRVTINNNADNTNNKVVSINDSDMLTELLAQLQGPVMGTTYKIEVTTPLKPDGTFWACPITSGFVRDKLEPFSELLKTAILEDPSLRKVEDFNGLLCVRSKENHLLTRCILIKEVNERTVKVQLIDMGRIEDHIRSKLFRVPETLANIPYMAFHCSLFEQKVNLSYQERWKFADLCKRKILDFTCVKSIVREQKQLLIGKIENTAESPAINIIEEIKLAILSDDL